MRRSFSRMNRCSTDYRIVHRLSALRIKRQTDTRCFGLETVCPAALARKLSIRQIPCGNVQAWNGERAAFGSSETWVPKPRRGLTATYSLAGTTSGPTDWIDITVVPARLEHM